MKLKNKKGFTLIELLAVIVVLAIIALIATPIVMNTIKNAKKGAAERTADNYIKQVETAITTSKLDNKEVADGTYTIDENGNLTGNGLTKPITIEMNGEKPKGGSVVIANGQVTTDSTMEIGDYTVSYNPTNKKYEATEKNNSLVLCKAVTTATIGNVPQGNFAYGDEYTCELGDNDTKTFFLLETNGDNVSLIMNANVDSNGKAVTSSSTDKGIISSWLTKEDYLAAGGTESDWGNYGNNNLGPITANKKLKENTVNWTKLNQSQITLPTAEQITAASGKTFNSNSDTSVSGLSTWLFVNLATGSYPHGYWTSTPILQPTWVVFDVYCREGTIDCNSADLSSTSINLGYNLGVRPVITILKSQLG